MISSYCHFGMFGLSGIGMMPQFQKMRELTTSPRQVDFWAFQLPEAAPLTSWFDDRLFVVLCVVVGNNGGSYYFASQVALERLLASMGRLSVHCVAHQSPLQLYKFLESGLREVWKTQIADACVGPEHGTGWRH